MDASSPPLIPTRRSNNKGQSARHKGVAFGKDTQTKREGCVAKKEELRFASPAVVGSIPAASSSHVYVPMV